MNQMIKKCVFLFLYTVWEIVLIPSITSLMIWPILAKTVGFRISKNVSEIWSCNQQQRLELTMENKCSWVNLYVSCLQLRRGRAPGAAPVRVRTPTTQPSTAPPSPLCSRPRRPAPSARHLPPSWCQSESSNHQAMRVTLWTVTHGVP